MRKLRLFAAALWLAACSSELPHDAPFDPEAPAAKQARATLRGTVRLESETDHAGVAVQLLNAQRSYAALTLPDGSVAVAGVVPGTYALSVATRYYEAVTESVTLGLGQTLDLGRITLAARRTRVGGAALLQTKDGDLVGGADVTLRREGSLRGVAAAPGLAAPAATTQTKTFTTKSGSDGAYGFDDVPAGLYSVLIVSPGYGEETVERIRVTGEDGEVTLDGVTLLPMLGFVEIQGKSAAGAVSTATVTVRLTATGFPAEVELALDPAFLTAWPRFAMQPSTTVTLPAGDGVKALYARFFNARGEVSSTGADSVILDQTPPLAPQLTIREASPTRLNPVTIDYAAFDAAQVALAEGAGCPAAAREPIGAGTRTLTLSAAEGTKTLSARFFDAVGNATACVTRTIEYDPTPPAAGTFVLNYGQPASTAVFPVTFVGVSGATRVMVSEDAGFTNEVWQAYAPARSFAASPGNGTKTIYAKLADDAGNETTLGYKTIVVDTSPPSDPFVAAPNPVTAGGTVALQLSAPQAQDMLLSESPVFAGAVWEPLAANKIFPLSSGDGAKTIYVKFRKSSGLETAVVTATVVRDAAPPTLPALRINDGAAAAAANLVTLGLSAVDAVSGLAAYKINTLNSFGGVAPLTFQGTVAYPLAGTDGAKTLWVVYGDRAGNYSAPVSAAIVLDRTAPAVAAVAVQRMSGAAVASGATVTESRVRLVSSVSDLTPLEMQVTSTGTFAGAAWEPYAAARAIDLPASGTVTLAARVRDGAGHIVDLLSGFTLTVDSQGPTAPSVAVAGTVGGAVSSPTVTVNLAATGADFAELAYDVGFSLPLPAFAMRAATTVTLPGGDGAKTLYVRYFDAAGNASAIASASVVLDRTAPYVPTFTIDQGALTSVNPVTLTYAAAEAATVRIAEGAACAGTREAYTGAKTFTLTPGEGAKSISLQLFDAVGNATACLTRSIYFDPNPPVGGIFLLDYGLAATTSNTLTVSFTGVSGATRVKLSEDAGFAGAEWQAYGAVKTYVAAPGNGTKTVYVLLGDDAGNTLSLGAKTIAVDTTPTSTPSIVAAYEVTTQTSVAVFLAAGLVSEMLLSQDAAFAGAAWEPYAAAKTFALTGTDGAITIYAKFRKASGVETAVVSDTVQLDRTAPILPSLRVNNGAAVVASAIVTLNLSAVDAVSGVGTYQINTSDAFGGVSPKAYQPNDVYSLAPGDGVKTLVARFADRAGNTSVTTYTSVVLDTTPPAAGAVSVRLVDGTVLGAGATVREPRVVLVTSVSDVSDLEMQVTTNGSFAGAAWEPYTAAKVVDLGGTTASLSARVRDAAGHETALVTAFALAIDVTPPSALSLTLDGGAEYALPEPGYTQDPNIEVSLAATDWATAEVSEDVGFQTVLAAFTSATVFPQTVMLSAANRFDGAKTLYARFTDAAGNASAVVSRTIVLDGAKPAPVTLSIDGGAATTSDLLGQVQLAVGAADSTSGIKEMRVANSLADLAAAAPEPYAATKTWTLDTPGAGEEGPRTVYVSVTDRAGNTSDPVSATIRYDAAPPTLLAAKALVLAGDTAYTTLPYVEAALAVSGATEMMLSNDPAFAGASWEPYAGTTVWFLPAGDGVKWVYAKFRDQAGNLAGPYADAVTLDANPPAGLSLRIAGGAPYAITTAVELSLAAAGADFMELSNDGIFDTEPGVPFAATITGWALPAGDGVKYVYARFSDAAGNRSSVLVDEILLDTAGPTGASFSIQEAPLTPLLTVHLAMAATGATEMQYSEYGCTTAWVPFAPAAAYDIQNPVDGVKTISVRFRDAAGNTTACLQRSFTLDGTAPYITTMSPRAAFDGNSVSLGGINFGTGADGTVYFGTTPATVVSWTNMLVTVKVTSSMGPGIHSVTVVVGGRASNATPFTVRPVIRNVGPRAGGPTSLVTLRGLDFGATTGLVSVDDIEATVSTWGAAQVQFWVPNLGLGAHTVQLYGGGLYPSNTTTVVVVPQIASLTPNPALPGEVVTLTGTSLGTAGTVWVGEMPATVNSWSDTAVQFVVPAAPAGSAPVHLNAQGFDSAPAPFTVGGPAVNGMSTGAVTTGTTLTLRGTGFGSAPGAVLFESTAATVTDWYDTVVTVSTPGGLAKGGTRVFVQTAGGQTAGAVRVKVSGSDFWTPLRYPFQPGTVDNILWTGRELLRFRTGGTLGYTAAWRFNPISGEWFEGARTAAFTNINKAVWAGNKAVVWTSGQAYVYDPQLDTWTAATLTGNPGTRTQTTLVWTGQDAILWGGEGPVGPVNTGHRYNVASDTWTATSTGANTPDARRMHAAVWSGKVMIVFGGFNSVDLKSRNTGGRYDPASDTWQPTATAGAPSARSHMAHVWAGTEMIVLGGYESSTSTYPAGGGRYDPVTDHWAPVADGGPRCQFSYRTALWTGSVVITPYAQSSGGSCMFKYSPDADSFTALGTNFPPTAVVEGGAWTEQQAFFANTGTSFQMYHYYPGPNTWGVPIRATAPSTVDFPANRSNNAAVWTGTQMIVWGGSTAINTGSRYTPATDTWVATDTGGAPSGRGYPSAVWTGTEMIVWGGFSSGSFAFNSGGRYDPATNAWTALPSGGAPTIRYEHSAVWTGTQMIVWGGYNPALLAVLNDGGVWTAATNTWSATGAAPVGSNRRRHVAAWAGNRMLVWGGDNAGKLDSGRVYYPAGNTWATPSGFVSAAPNAPAPRDNHGADWDGTYLTVWGGVGSGGTAVNTGARYHLTNDLWTTIATTGSPAALQKPSVAVVGNKIIVASSTAAPTASVWVYDLLQSKWSQASRENEPDSFGVGPNGFWTGSEMLYYYGTFPAVHNMGRYIP